MSPAGCASGRMPLVCVAGYQRNMADFADFMRLFHRMIGEDWPVVLVDLKGRGRSSDRARQGALHLDHRCARPDRRSAPRWRSSARSSLGQGYGGQVMMALGGRAADADRRHGADRCRAGVAIRAGWCGCATTSAISTGTRSEAGLRAMFRRMLGADYPGAPEALLDVLAAPHALSRQARPGAAAVRSAPDQAARAVRARRRAGARSGRCSMRSAARR